MPKLHPVRNTFASGELDPALRGQHNLKAYGEGAAEIRNMVRRATGALARRPGTDDLAACNEGRLDEFEFSDAQRYVLNFCDYGLQIFDLNGVLLQTLAGPWALAEVDALTMTQSGDTLVITNTAPTQVLRRIGATVFTLSPFAFDRSPNDDKIYQPYYKFARPEVTLTPSAATGSITLTASDGFFSTAYIGQRLRLYDAEVEITAYTSPTVATASVKGTLVGRLGIDPFKTEKNATKVEVQHINHGLATGSSITFSGVNDVGFIPGSKFNTSFTITVVDENHYTIDLAPLSYTVREDANFDGNNENTTWSVARDSLDGGGANCKFSVAGTPTRNWAEPVVSAIRGYPAASAFHEKRLWLGGTTQFPDWIGGSDVLQPFRFDVGKGLDAQSVQGTIGSEDVSRVRHIISNNDLQFMTPLAEFVALTRQGEPITPTNVRIKSQGDAGIGDINPIRFDGATLFVQENGLSVSEFTYSERQAQYLPVPVSTLAGHLVRRPRRATTSPGSSSRAEQTAYFVNEDGTVACFHSMRSENLAGWGLWELGGGALVRSAAAIGGYLYLNVLVRGSHRLYRLAEGGIYCLDGQHRHVDSEATVNWQLTPAVRGRTVSLVSEKGYHGEWDIPADGIITLDIPVLNLVAGDDFRFRLKLLPPVVELPNGSMVGEIQRVVTTIVDVIDAWGLTINGKRVKNLSAADVSTISPLNGTVVMRHLGYARQPGTVISQAEPVPVEGVLSVLEEVLV